MVSRISRNMYSVPGFHPDFTRNMYSVPGFVSPDFTFMDNSQVQAVLSRKAISSAQAKAALDINAQARLNALRMSLLILGGLALLMVIPGRNLPGHTKSRISGFDERESG